MFPCRIFSTLLALAAAATAAPTTMITATNTTKPGCPRHCGNLTIPYPFGIGLSSGCSFSPYYYDILCLPGSATSNSTAATATTARAFLPSGQDENGTMIEILDVSETQIRTRTQVAYVCFNSTANDMVDFRLQGYAPYTLSVRSNALTVVGCQDEVSLLGYSVWSFLAPKEHGTECAAKCTDTGDVAPGFCNGKGCCQAAVPMGIRAFSVLFLGGANHSDIKAFNPCGYAFVAEKDTFKFRGAADLDDPEFLNRTTKSATMVLDWVIGNRTCEQAQRNSSSYACQNHTECIDSDSGIGGYNCKCLPGYQGNPYLSPGCTDIDECADSQERPCISKCINTPGNYTCPCPPGYFGDGRRKGSGCRRHFPLLGLSLGVGLGSLFLLIVVSWTCLVMRKRRLVKIKERFFQDNGGVLLNQLLSSNNHQGNTDSAKIFTIEELKSATNNFSDDQILGKGGYGTVYKGVLSDKQVVATKKSKIVDQTQIEQFINEVVILARTNHPNVVKLLGCCLETEVPLLVYEFIPNGTLFDHIHEEGHGASWLSWNNCLRIATEAANALTYLHTIPIVHRDVKSTNILLDEKCAVKISDFGASRLIPVDQTRLATLVQGTLGYLDPEYFLSSQLTDKSDVYSFGVVLTELLTRERPISSWRETEERNLANYFVKSFKEGRLYEVLEHRLVEEAQREELIAIAKLTQQCLSMKGEDRPSMKDVASELEELRKHVIHTRENNDREEINIMNNIEEDQRDLYPIPPIPRDNLKDSDTLWST